MKRYRMQTVGVDKTVRYNILDSEDNWDVVHSFNSYNQAKDQMNHMNHEKSEPIGT